MKPTCRVILFIAMVGVVVSCDRKPKAADAATDDAKLRPELAAARKTASPTPMPGEARVSPTATP
jgi:hypothetical protein